MGGGGISREARRKPPCRAAVCLALERSHTISTRLLLVLCRRVDCLAQRTDTLNGLTRHGFSMPSPRDERLDDLRRLRERIRRHPQNFAAFLVELHAFVKELYENAARAVGESDRFAVALAELCGSRGLERWEELLTPDQRTQFFKDARDADVAGILAFWAELDEPLDF